MQTRSFCVANTFWALIMFQTLFQELYIYLFNPYISVKFLLLLSSFPFYDQGTKLRWDSNPGRVAPEPVRFTTALY